MLFEMTIHIVEVAGNRPRQHSSAKMLAKVFTNEREIYLVITINTHNKAECAQNGRKRKNTLYKRGLE